MREGKRRVRGGGGQAEESRMIGRGELSKKVERKNLRHELRRNDTTVLIIMIIIMIIIQVLLS